MKLSLLVILSTLAFSALSAVEYPTSPNLQVTPGTLCSHPDYYRYPEQIAYCERDVSSQTKKDIFELYRSQFGYVLNPANRSSYKIDHFIPLCAGGSNEITNLWPQHAAVYQITDPLEAVGCEKLSDAKITQKDLIELIRKAKMNLSEAPKILKQIRAL